MQAISLLCLLAVTALALTAIFPSSKCKVVNRYIREHLLFPTAIGFFMVLELAHLGDYTS